MSSDVKEKPSGQEKSPRKTSRQFGKYKLIAHLATGGMAEIFLASQSSLAGFSKLLVIKRILPHLAKEERFVRMFLDEARIAAMLNHPNVVSIFDLGVIDGCLFIAMEYLSGESLSKVVKTCRSRSSCIPPEIAAGMILQAAEGLHHAHALVGPDGKPMQIVHRDVSPQNIFALYDGGVKVVDFGIAKASNRSTKTQTGMLKGKYSYMSPEQVLTKDLDGRSDVFALGVVLWELLTCRKLFNQESDLGLLRAVIENDSPSPSSVNPEVPLGLDRIALKALVREPGGRYQSAAEMRADLAAFLKTREASGDTIAIASFMHKLFAERIEKRRQVIERAVDGDSFFDDSIILDAVGRYLSDTEHSIPDSAPHHLREGIPVPSVNKRSKRRISLLWFGMGCALLLVLLGGVALNFEWSELLFGEGIQSIKDGGDDIDRVVGAVDGGAIGDARVGGEPSEWVDAGNVNDAWGLEFNLDVSDAGLDGKMTGRIDGANGGGVSRGRKRKHRRRRNIPIEGKKVDVGHPQNNHVVGVASGPPGKLRLMTRPWAEIYYKGKRLGQTPLVDVELPSGWVKLRAVNKEAGINRILSIQIPEGGTITKQYNLLSGGG